MYCSNCGQALEESQSFCNQCGCAADKGKANELRGYSEKIRDPAFASYKKKSASWSFIFASILALIAIIAFPIYGNKSGDIDWPYSLYYGFGIGGMFIIIAALQTIKRAVDKTWDGVVIDKQVYNRTERSSNGHNTHHTIYVIKVKKDSGGKKRHQWRDTPGLYNYYNIGDRVRHHKGFAYYEKYDKSQDSKIMCAACMSFADIDASVCPRCKCPLLK
jgi:hypothetical protein